MTDCAEHYFSGTEIVPYSALSGGELHEVVIDKPFLFLIKDTLLDTIIFVGKIANPAQK
jgi:serine protease inhibitor